MHAEFATVERTIDLLRYVMEDVSFGFDRWGDHYVRGPSLYFLVLSEARFSSFVDELGTNRWPVERAHVVVSTESDLFSGATAAVSTLKGPLHGGAPGLVLEMLREVHETGDPERYVRETLDAGDRLMGFGHRVYRARDPRVAVLKAAAERFYHDSGGADFFRTVRAFEDIATERLADHSPDRRLETNVEFYTAVLLDGLDIPKELFTVTVAVARVSGWMAHVLEQLDDNRLVRPTARYVGDTGCSWTPVEKRG